MYRNKHSSINTAQRLIFLVVAGIAAVFLFSFIFLQQSSKSLPPSQANQIIYNQNTKILPRVSNNTTSVALVTSSTASTTKPIPVTPTTKSQNLTSQTSTPPAGTSTSKLMQAPAPTTEPPRNQRAFINATVAVICVGPPTGALQFYTMGSGVVINPNGYLLTNAHVIQNSRQCFLGRQYIDASGNFHTAAAAVYNFLNIVGTGNWQSIEDIMSPTSEQITASLHDFAVLKIGDRFTPSLWNSNGYQLSSLNIPVASDADYAKYFTDGKFPAIGVNFSYQPVMGDLLFSSGYIGDTGRSSFTFSQGKISTITNNSIGTEMSSGEGLSGSPLVDSNYNLVGLIFLLNCGIVGGGSCYTSQPNALMPSGFTYGNYNLSLSVPFLNQAMKEDLGFDLKDLTSKQ